MGRGSGSAAGAGEAGAEEGGVVGSGGGEGEAGAGGTRKEGIKDGSGRTTSYVDRRLCRTTTRISTERGRWRRR